MWASLGHLSTRQTETVDAEVMDPSTKKREIPERTRR